LRNWTWGQLLFENTEQWITWLGGWCALEFELQNMWASTVWKHIVDCWMSEMHTFSMTPGKSARLGCRTKQILIHLSTFKKMKFQKCRHSIAVQDWLASFLLHHKKPKQIPSSWGKYRKQISFCLLGFSHKMSYFFWPWKDLLFWPKTDYIRGGNFGILELRSHFNCRHKA